MTLSGIKVLELGVWAAAPSAAAILGDWGAEVIKIENPDGGDPCREKRGWEALDLKLKIGLLKIKRPQ